MDNRTKLALDACAGMTDEDIAGRGHEGFIKMIIRKRTYAAMFRKAMETLKSQSERIDLLENELVIARKSIEHLVLLDSEVKNPIDVKQVLSAITLKHKDEPLH